MMDLISRKEAIGKGLSRFFTGAPCSRGHISERRVKNYDCCECRKLRRKSKRPSKPPENKLKLNTGKKIKKKEPKAHPNAHKARTIASKRIKACLVNQLKNESNASPYQFQKHMESQFTKEMNWENYGSVWHVDHVIPLSLFDLTDKEHRAIAGHYTNLQPLTVKDNIKKSIKIIVDTQIELTLPCI